MRKEQGVGLGLDRQRDLQTVFLKWELVDLHPTATAPHGLVQESHINAGISGEPAPHSSSASTMPGLVNLPPFPEDVPTHPLLVVDYDLLLTRDEAEIEKLWKAATELGFW